MVLQKKKGGGIPMKKFLLLVVMYLFIQSGHAGEWSLGPNPATYVSPLARKAAVISKKDFEMSTKTAEKILEDNNQLLLPPRGSKLKELIESYTTPHFYQKTLHENFGDGFISPQKMFEVISNKKFLYVKWLKEEGASWRDLEAAAAALELLRFPLFVHLALESTKSSQRSINT